MAPCILPGDNEPMHTQSSPGREGSLRAHIVDVTARTVYPAELSWRNGQIVAIDALADAPTNLPFLLPGFIDAHVHIESSMLPPAEFGRLAVRHGTIASVSDPHEIANVLGINGVRWMLENAAQSPFHVLFGAPSCVPATPFETAGATLDAGDVAALLDLPGVGYLSEVMNYPGVLAGDESLCAKIAAARQRGLPVDGHAPGLAGKDAARYAAAGISTDHECMTLAEAEDKLRAGMSILIREGSAARNFDALHPLISLYPGRIMLCSDDRHPDDLAAGHINRLVARAVALGHDLFDVLDAACLTPQRHYFSAGGEGLPLGALRIGDPMNAALVDDLQHFDVRATWLNGVQVMLDGRSLLPRIPCTPVNRFDASPVEASALRIIATSSTQRVIVAEDGQLLTREAMVALPLSDGVVLPSVTGDVLLLAVVNRYQAAPPALALIRGFGLKEGALASSVAHDSHNVIGIGCDPASLAAALNAVIASKGGLAVALGDGRIEQLPLPIGGLMSDDDGDRVAARYSWLTRLACNDLGSPLRSPFMTLSFMALLVIPELKLGDRGLFDGRSFTFTDVSCPD